MRAHIHGSMPRLKAGYGYLWWTRPTREGAVAYFASGVRSQLIANFPDRNLVMALASASTFPGGATKFINEVVLPAEAALPAGTACVARLDQ
jgi:CubicO group peptidase (beta-lactamase class C family)